MGRTAKVSGFFGDADHDFRIGIGEAEELEDQFGLGLMELMERTAVVHVREIAAVLRVGLVGGGLRKDKAAQLVSRHFAPGYLLEGAELAAKVLAAAVRGVPDDPPDPKPGEPDGEGAESLASPMGEFAIPGSSPPAA